MALKVASNAPQGRRVAGHKVRHLRALRGETQEGLARSADIGVATLIRIEHGTNPNPWARTLGRLAAALDVPLDDLLEAADDDPVPAVAS